MKELNMKKTITLLALLNISSVYALEQVDLDTQAKREAYEKAHFTKEGLPYPDGGIKVIPRAQMSSYQNPEKKKETDKFNEDIQKYGYIHHDHPSTERLLNFLITSKNKLAAYGNESNPQDTHLKRSLNDVQLAYQPTRIDSIVDQYIGAAPYLTYLQDQGWVGVIQYFSMNSIGNCSFSENNIKLSHGSIILAQEIAKSDVNGKVTTKEVMGTPESGFTYTVEWYDDSFFRTVECATKTYSPSTINKVTELSKKIDSQ